MSQETDWLARKAQVKADLGVFLNQGFPLEIARRLANWSITLEYSTFADVSTFPPPLVTPLPDELTDSIRLLVSRSPARTNGAQNLEGAVLDAGKLYAVFVPDVPELGITSIEFKLNGVSHHTEHSVPWDYDGTAGGGDANRVTFVAGAYTITVIVASPSGTFSLDADFNVE